MKTLYIIRGLPGSGKSTLGEQLAEGYLDYHPEFGGMKSHSYAADDWFTDREGNYEFKPEELTEAHDECQSRVRGSMMSGVEVICVCNTFSQAWEAVPYFKMCTDFGYIPVVIECQSEFGNIHGCPKDKIEEMRERWEPLTSQSDR
jgi:hypothetical protein